MVLLQSHRVSDQGHIQLYSINSKNKPGNVQGPGDARKQSGFQAGELFSLNMNYLHFYVFYFKAVSTGLERVQGFDCLSSLERAGWNIQHPIWSLEPTRTDAYVQIFFFSFLILLVLGDKPENVQELLLVLYRGHSCKCQQSYCMSCWPYSSPLPFVPSFDFHKKHTFIVNFDIILCIL